MHFFYNASDGDDVFADGLADNAIWKSLPFVKKGNLHKLHRRHLDLRRTALLRAVHQRARQHLHDGVSQLPRLPRPAPAPGRPRADAPGRRPHRRRLRRGVLAARSSWPRCTSPRAPPSLGAARPAAAARPAPTTRPRRVLLASRLPRLLAAARRRRRPRLRRRGAAVRRPQPARLPGHARGQRGRPPRGRRGRRVRHLAARAAGRRPRLLRRSRRGRPGDGDVLRRRRPARPG